MNDDYSDDCYVAGGTIDEIEFDAMAVQLNREIDVITKSRDNAIWRGLAEAEAYANGEKSAS